MKVIGIAENFLLYQVDPPEGGIEGLNFMAIVEDGKILFLDTGYAPNMEEALADLARLGAKPAGAIVSHFHPDHDGGLSLLGKVEVWAGEHWRETASRWLEPGASVPVEPPTVVSSRTTVEFGRRRLELIPLPGHSDDSLAILVDDTWLYVADTVLLTNDGRPLLPSVHSRPVSRHVEAIDRLIEMSRYVFVPGHGSVMGDRAGRERDLANRRRYLSAIAEAKGPISFNEATAGCEPPFLGKEWHEHNYL
jgi:glyoxylase-like metal-dependent hydrolase (beta-lactamase superfamily II)